MSKEETISILKLESYNGQRSEYTDMYFKTEAGAVEWLEKNGYEPDILLGWKKSYFNTARVERAKLY